MELFLSAVLGDLTSRSISFIINKCSKPPALAVEYTLQRALLRAQVIIDEAMGRHITNQAMLLQLNMLRDAIHRGHYLLDTFRYQPHDEDDAKDPAVSGSSSLSKVSSSLCLCFSSRGAQALKEMQNMLNNLSSMILDVSEIVMFLRSYPRLYYQPYSMHLQLANCMFGRQMEAQLVINFLLQPQPHGAENFEVLPIIGPSQVGKSTLVSHVCKDERVCDHFSEILFFHNHDFTDDGLATFRGGVMKHQSRVSNSDKDGRLLLVVDLVGDLNEDAWNRMYSSFKWSKRSGHKIIVTSRSDKIVKFGTTQALSLKYVSREAYWYFFKTLTFGSTDPEMHPRLAHLAMEIAKTQNRSFIGANITASLLRDNFDIHFWCKVLTFLRASFQKHVAKFGEHPSDLLRQNRPAHLGRMATPCEDLVIYHHCQHSSQEEVPSVTFQEVLYGSVKPHAKFEVLAWRSRIPPYYSHVFTCEVAGQKTITAKRKRSLGNGVTPS